MLVRVVMTDVAFQSCLENALHELIRSWRSSSCAAWSWEARHMWDEAVYRMFHGSNAFGRPWGSVLVDMGVSAKETRLIIVGERAAVENNSSDSNRRLS